MGNKHYYSRNSSHKPVAVKHATRSVSTPIPHPKKKALSYRESPRSKKRRRQDVSSEDEDTGDTSQDSEEDASDSESEAEESGSSSEEHRSPKKRRHHYESRPSKTGRKKVRIAPLSG